MTKTTFDPKLLAMRIRRYRIEAGLTQQELAKRTKLQPAAVSHFETGHRTPSVPNLLRICIALNVPPGWLLADYLDAKLQ